MKWTNKGHEFDEIGAVFQKNSTLVLIGNRSDNDVLRKKLDFLGVAIENIGFDSDIKVRSSKDPFINLFHRVFNKIKRIKKQMEVNKFYKQQLSLEQTGKTIVISGGGGAGKLNALSVPVGIIEM